MCCFPEGLGFPSLVASEHCLLLLQLARVSEELPPEKKNPSVSWSLAESSRVQEKEKALGRNVSFLKILGHFDCTIA